MINYSNVNNEIKYLMEFYTEAQIDYYARGNEKKVVELYKKTQPKKIKIGSLKNIINQKIFLVSSPDGWVPVLDCIEKKKDSIYCFTFKSGRKIKASANHLYQKADNSWHYAKNCNIGDDLLSIDGIDTITSINNVNKLTKVYDLSVDHENHRYYTNGICSHNSGKSLFLQNLACNWLAAGLNGVYITLELKEELVSMRLDSMLTGISSRDIFKQLDEVELTIGVLGKKSGKLRIKYMPPQSTSNDIRAYLKELKIQTGIEADFLLTDYLDLMAPASQKISASDSFTKDKLVSEELRNLGYELNLLNGSASQINRSGVDQIEFDYSNIAGGISKVNTADNLFGILSSRAMKERGVIQLQPLKTRNSAGGVNVDLAFDVNTLRISDLDAADKVQTGSDIMKQIKNGSSLKANELQSSGKVITPSNKLQSMLDKLKHDKS